MGRWLSVCSLLLGVPLVLVAVCWRLSLNSGFVVTSCVVCVRVLFCFRLGAGVVVVGGVGLVSAVGAAVVLLLLAVGCLVRGGC